MHHGPDLTGSKAGMAAHIEINFTEDGIQSDPIISDCDRIMLWDAHNCGSLAAQGDVLALIINYHN
jgi:hypothetical protein